MKPTAAHHALMADLKAALKPHGDLTAAEMLAVVSQLVGNLIALQDQTRMTPAQALQIVSGNIEIGNAAALATILGPAAGNA